MSRVKGPGMHSPQFFDVSALTFSLQYLYAPRGARARRTTDVEGFGAVWVTGDEKRLTLGGT